MSSARTSGRRLFSGAAVNGLAYAVQLAVAFRLSPYLVHHLGDSRYGVWSVIESVLAYLTLLDLGVAAAVVRYVARFDAAQDNDGLNRIFNTSLALFAGAGAMALTVTAALAYPAFGLLPFPAELADEGRLMLLLLGFNLAVGLPLGTFASAADGRGLYAQKSVVRTVSLLARSAVMVVLVGRGGGLVPLALTLTVASLLEHAVLAWVAFRGLPGLRLSWRYVDRATFRSIRGYSTDALFALVAGRISFQTDALVIGAFLSLSNVTFFALAARLVEYAKNGARAGTTVLTPAVSALEARGDLHGVRGVLVNGTRYVLWLILPVQLGLLTLGGPFLHAWMGPEYVARSYPTLAILTLPLALAMAQSVAARVLYGTGELRWFSRVVLAEAAANLALSLLLVGPLGIEGVALGTALPNAVANLAVVRHACRLSDLPLAIYARRALLAPLGASVLLGALWLGMCQLQSPEGWAELIAVGAAGLCAYLPLVVLLERGALRRLIPAGAEARPAPVLRAGG